MKKVLVVWSKAFNEEQRTTLDIVKKALKARKIKAVFCDRQALNNATFVYCDLVIAVGGDGTFLRASDFIKYGTPVLGVNLDIQNNEGYYMQ